jgi:hypothetical protein
LPYFSLSNTSIFVHFDLYIFNVYIMCTAHRKWDERTNSSQFNTNKNNCEIALWYHMIELRMGSVFLFLCYLCYLCCNGVQRCAAEYLFLGTEIYRKLYSSPLHISTSPNILEIKCFYIENDLAIGCVLKYPLLEILLF